MPLTIWNWFLSYKQKNYFSENRLVLPRNSQMATGGKWDFQVANLLLATVNFEPCVTIFIWSKMGIFHSTRNI